MDTVTWPAALRWATGRDCLVGIPGLRADYTPVCSLLIVRQVNAGTWQA